MTPGALDGACRPAGHTGAARSDVLGVGPMVIDPRVFPGPAGQPPPPGWSLATRDRLRTVWVRDEAIGYGGRLSWVSPGVDVLSDAGTGVSEEVQVRAAEAGTLVFARLAWPGYTATLDGEPVDVRDGPAGLLAVDVPAGRHLVEIDFRSPGLAGGADVLAAAALLSLVQTGVWLVARWRWGRRSVASPDAPRARLEPERSGDGRREDVVPVGTSGR